jgi:hypothetical protein
MPEDRPSASGSPDLVTLVALGPSGLPEPVELDREALRATLIQDPQLLGTIVADALARGVRPREGRFPLNTPITEMIRPDQVGSLSDAARRLTKQNLMELGGWSGVTRKSYQELGLSVKDIQALRDVFATQMQPGADPGLAAEDAFSFRCCCCCTPCCCAAAEADPIRPLG